MSEDSISGSATIASEEEWRVIPGTDNLYSASSLGRVRSEPQTDGLSRKGQCHRGRILKLGRAKSGHLSFKVYRRGVRPRPMYVHQAVALVFLGPCPDGMEVDHKNSMPSDNRPGNLEYVTHLENIRRAAANGLLRPSRGEANGCAKLTDAAVRSIREEYPAKSMRELGRIRGVTHRVICDIIAGRKWRHVI